QGAALPTARESTVTRTTHTSGTYMNMQFMQHNNDPNTHDLWCSIGGSGNNDNPKLSYDGVAYFPTQNFWTRGNAILKANSPSLAIVADKIWTQGNATVTITHYNPRNLSDKQGQTTTFAT